MRHFLGGLAVFTLLGIAHIGASLDAQAASKLKVKSGASNGQKLALLTPMQNSDAKSVQLKQQSPLFDSGNKTNAASSRQLIGRIEELRVGNNILPPEKSGAIPDIVASTSIESYPHTFVGTWVGKVVIDVNAGTLLEKHDPALWLRQRGILFPGRTGLVRIDFQQFGQTVRSLPPTAQFNSIASDMKYMDLVKHQTGANPSFKIHFGARMNATTITGTGSSTKVTVDRLTPLENDVYEQQIATDNQVVDKNNHTTSFGATEVVMRFRRLSGQQMNVDLALVEYAGDGAMESKLIMHGTLIKQ